MAEIKEHWWRLGKPISILNSQVKHQVINQPTKKSIEVACSLLF
jgi:hypothetical protein